jgi:hypothetical protein
VIEPVEITLPLPVDRWLRSERSERLETPPRPHPLDHALPSHERRPVALARAGEFERIDEAFAFEKQVQGWGRRKREALIDGQLGALPMLSSRSKRARAARRER